MKIGRETRSGELLLEIILRRHEVRSTIMTSNRPVEEWEQAAGRRSRRRSQRSTVALSGFLPLRVQPC